MVTGASTADLAVVLLDARKGASSSPAPRVHRALLGIPNVVVAVNKMDLVDYDQGRFEEIVAGVRAFIEKLDIKECIEIPIVGAARRQRRQPLAADAVVRRADPCSRTSSRSKSPTTIPTRSRRGSPCSG